MKPRILLVNDDGIGANGLKHLAHALAGVGELWVVAPALEQSGVGTSVTLRTPLEVRQTSFEGVSHAWHVNGTPADCVRLALSQLLPEKPQLVISGINKGANSGRTIFYSGTIGGVIEATIQGIPGIAVSYAHFTHLLYAQVEPYVASIVKTVLENSLPQGTFLNVNFPDMRKEFKGIRMARQGRSYGRDNIEARKHPDGYTYYWMGYFHTDEEEHEESDIALLEQGYATIAPIHIGEMTDRAFLEKGKELFPNNDELLTPLL